MTTTSFVSGRCKTENEIAISLRVFTQVTRGVYTSYDIEGLITQRIHSKAIWQQLTLRRSRYAARYSGEVVCKCGASPNVLVKWCICASFPAKKGMKSRGLRKPSNISKGAIMAGGGENMPESFWASRDPEGTNPGQNSLKSLPPIWLSGQPRNNIMREERETKNNHELEIRGARGRGGRPNIIDPGRGFRIMVRADRSSHASKAGNR